MSRSYQHYTPRRREQAVALVAQLRPHHDSEWAAIRAAAGQLHISSPETLRKWIRQSEIDAGQRPGTPSQLVAELKRLRRENAELRRANQLLRARPHPADGQRALLGVEHGPASDAGTRL